MEPTNTISKLNQTREHYLDILNQVIQPQTDISNVKDIYTYQAILDDQQVVADLIKMKPKPTYFKYGKQKKLKASPSWRQKPGVTFRSESVGIVYSDIVALDQNCILLELSNETGSQNLKLEAGVKNKDKIDISLYKGSDLIEKLQLQKRISWDLDRLDPGDYRLMLGKQKSFQFEIQE